MAENEDQSTGEIRPEPTEPKLTFDEVAFQLKAMADEVDMWGSVTWYGEHRRLRVRVLEAAAKIVLKSQFEQRTRSR